MLYYKEIFVVIAQNGSACHQTGKNNPGSDPLDIFSLGECVLNVEIKVSGVTYLNSTVNGSHDMDRSRF